MAEDCDPSGERGGISLYGFVGNSPVKLIDILGLAGYESRMGAVDDKHYKLIIEAIARLKAKKFEAKCCKDKKCFRVTEKGVGRGSKYSSDYGDAISEEDILEAVLFDDIVLAYGHGDKQHNRSYELLYNSNDDIADSVLQELARWGNTDLTIIGCYSPEHPDQVSYAYFPRGKKPRGNVYDIPSWSESWTN